MSLISIISQNDAIIGSYKRLLESKEYRLDDAFILDKKIRKLTQEIVIIDLDDTHGLDLLNFIYFQENSYIMIISPIPRKNINLPNSLSLTNIFFMTKPIDIAKFHSFIKNSREQIEHSKYTKNKEKILIKTIDNSPLRMAIYDLEGKMLYSNKPYILANSIDSVENFSFEELKNCNVHFGDVIHNLRVHQIYTSEMMHDFRWYKSFFYFAEAGRNVVHVCLDETEEKQQIQSLKKSAQFFEKSNEGAIITDSRGRITVANDSFCKITGYTKEEAVGKSTRILSSGVHDKSFYENMWDTLKHYGKWQGEIWNKRKNGEIYPEWLSITKLSDDSDEALNYMAIFTDISALKETDKKLRFYANHDHLTGLLNKAQFENMLEHSINRSIRNNTLFALFFIDLDYFKEVNDTAGHNVGDLVLKEVAKRFQKVLRNEDILARIGGDEFTIIMENVKEESDPMLLAEKLNDSIKKPFNIEGEVFYLSLSIGIALYPLHGKNTSELSKNADAAMYEVKNSGRNNALLYNEKFTEKLVKKVTLHNDLKKAVQNDDLEVYYQLVVDVNTQKVTGAEALIRWKHKEKGFISPDEFIPIAEHHGLIVKVGQFVLQRSCEVLPTFLNQFGTDFILAINVSSKEIIEENYTKHIIETVKDFHISAQNIELELTETSLMKNDILAIEKMQELKQAGFHLAIDDFGTGYSSLSYLKKFPIDKIKIDQSFVSEITYDKDDDDMVQAIINIAKVFNLSVQAEGIETLEQLIALRKHGIDIAQGYYYAKPLDVNEIFLRDWSFASLKETL